MTPLTPEQRLRAYEWVLGEIEKEGNRRFFIAHLNAWHIIYIGDRATLQECFPEAYARYDWLTEISSTDLFDLMQYVLILDCIEEVKGLIRK